MKGISVNKKVMIHTGLALLGLASLLQLSCGGHSSNGASMGNGIPASAQDVCNCTDNEPGSSDFRTDAKHVDLPQIGATDIAVADMLKWAVPPEPAFDAPRQGIELQMFHIPNGFLQFAWMNPGDCDLHLEISDSPDKNAPRVIVETPPHGQLLLGSPPAGAAVEYTRFHSIVQQWRVAGCAPGRRLRISLSGFQSSTRHSSRGDGVGTASGSGESQVRPERIELGNWLIG